MEQPNQDLEIGDVENYKGSSDIGFNHSTLVMRAFQKVLEAGSTELRAGWFNSKTDKNGNVTRIYIPDTRKVFIEAVKTAEMMLSCDMDNDAEKNIPIIKTKLKEFEEQLIKQDDKAWEQLPHTDKSAYINKGYTHTVGYIDMPMLKTKFIETQLDSAREVFCELNKLVKRLDFFANEQVET